MFKTLSLVVALGAAAFAYDTSRTETFTGRVSLNHQYEIVGVYGAPWQFPQAEPVNCYLDFTLWKRGQDFRHPHRNPQFEAQDSQKGCNERLDQLAYRLSQTKHSDSDTPVTVEAQCHPLSNWSATPDCDVTSVTIAGRNIYTR